MADITMCATEDCPIKNGCRRSPASGTKPSEWRQSWSAFRWAFDGLEIGCDHYWPTRERAATRAALDQEGGRDG